MFYHLVLSRESWRTPWPKSAWSLTPIATTRFRKHTEFLGKHRYMYDMYTVENSYMYDENTGTCTMKTQVHVRYVHCNNWRLTYSSDLRAGRGPRFEHALWSFTSRQLWTPYWWSWLPPSMTVHMQLWLSMWRWVTDLMAALVYQGFYLVTKYSSWM